MKFNVLILIVFSLLGLIVSKTNSAITIEHSSTPIIALPNTNSKGGSTLTQTTSNPAKKETPNMLPINNSMPHSKLITTQTPLKSIITKTTKTVIVTPPPKTSVIDLRWSNNNNKPTTTTTKTTVYTPYSSASTFHYHKNSNSTWGNVFGFFIIGILCFISSFYVICYNERRAIKNTRYSDMLYDENKVTVIACEAHDFDIRTFNIEPKVYIVSGNPFYLIIHFRFSKD